MYVLKYNNSKFLFTPLNNFVQIKEQRAKIVTMPKVSCVPNQEYNGESYDVEGFSILNY